MKAGDCENSTVPGLRAHQSFSFLVRSSCFTSFGAGSALIHLYTLPYSSQIMILLENRDRLAQVWCPVRDHLRWLLTHFPHNQQLTERAVVAIIRIAHRNLFRLAQHPSHAMHHHHHPPLFGGSELTTNLHRLQIPNKSVVIVVEEEQLQMGTTEGLKIILKNS